MPSVRPEANRPSPGGRDMSVTPTFQSYVSGAAGSQPIIVPLSWYKDSDGTAATDLSVSQHSQWVRWPSGATSAMVSWGNTGTGSPVGVRKIYISGHGGAGGATTADEL